MADRYALIATEMGHKRRKSPEWMHEMAVTLCRLDVEREQTKGKRMSDDHLKQIAGK
jgi:hypothetical protein